jgi:hypothetical protein
MKNSRLFFALSLLTIMSFLAQTPMVFAYDINLPGQNINIDPSGNNVEINYPSADKSLEVNQNNTTSTINTPGGTVKIDNSGNQVQTSVGNSTTTITNTPTSSMINIEANGKTVQIDASQGSLNLQVQSGNISDDQKTAILSLTNGSDVLISTNEDLQTYNNLVLEKRPTIVSINSNNNQVQIEYKQPAKLFGLFRSNLKASVIVDSTGKVEIKLPWYKFFFSKKTDPVKSNISLNLNNAAQSNTLNISTMNSGTDSTLQVRTQAKTINIVTDSINSTVTNNPSTDTNSSSTQTNSTTCQVPSEFPFGNYPPVIDLATDANQSSVIATGVDTGDRTVIGLLIAKSADLSNNTKVTSAYIFNGIDIPQTASVTTLYMHAGARVDRPEGANIVLLSQSDLVRKAMVAANLLGAECNY